MSCGAGTPTHPDGHKFYVALAVEIVRLGWETYNYDDIAQATLRLQASQTTQSRFQFMWCVKRSTIISLDNHPADLCLSNQFVWHSRLFPTFLRLLVYKVVTSEIYLKKLQSALQVSRFYVHFYHRIFISYTTLRAISHINMQRHVLLRPATE